MRQSLSLLAFALCCSAWGQNFCPTGQTSSTCLASTIASLTLNNSGSGASSGTTFNGSTAATLSYNTLGAAPLANPSFTTGITSPKFSSTTNCSAVGTAASPSLVACSAAPAGAFSCAVTASAATCVVSTTAVTANSEIFVQEVADEGARLGVTCNTTPSSVPSITLASKSAGTSFTINVPTITTNPSCFDYVIYN